METPPVRTRTPDASPSAPRRPWTPPVVEDLGNMADLTLQTSFSGDCDIFDPGCGLGGP